ncbi:MAG: hypothetical protein NUV54_00355, partial [Candidatus Taylorbacteria bacterium]|nr:hypothetical protein [Candidatus Taylorbacteria bacterium]
MKPDTSEFKKQEEAEDPIRDLEKHLYSREHNFSAGTRSDMRLKKHDIEVQKDWEGDGVPEARRTMRDTSSRMTFLKKFFIFSVV